jgi:acetolactate synthase-1/2/3 large subunit
LLIAGGGGIGTARGRQALKAASEAHQLPVALTFKRQDYFPNTHAHYVGHLGFKMPKATIDRYLGADLILAVGTRLGEATTQGYTLPQAPHPRQPLIHVHDDARQIGRNYAAAHALIADPVAFLEALAARAGAPSAKRAVGHRCASRSPRAWPGRCRPTVARYGPCRCRARRDGRQGRDLRNRRRQFLRLAAGTSCSRASTR